MYKIRLKEDYDNRIRTQLQGRFGYTNVMEIPRLEKIIVSRRIGGAVADKKLAEQAIEELGMIAGQHAVLCKSKKDISNFKLRKGMPIGAKVTLRRERMFEFLDRFINVAAPRMRDFRGMPANGFDGRGNYNLGIKEQIVFPEINIDKVYKILGMDITLVTTAKTDEEAMELLKAFGFPFAKPDAQ